MTMKPDTSLVELSADAIQFWREVEALILPIPEPEIEYRIHYNDDGDIIMLTHLPTDHPKTTQYIVVDEATYKDWGRYKIKNGKLVPIIHDLGIVSPLIKSTTGIAVVKNHANLKLDDDEIVKEVEYYDYRQRV